MFDRDFIGCFEGKLKVFRDLVDKPAQVFISGEGIVGSVNAHRFEYLGVFFEADPIEASFRELPSVDVSSFVIQLMAPAGVFP